MSIDIRSIMSDTGIMKSSEFIKKVKALGKRNDSDVRVDEKRGKGSHVTLYYGDRFTIVRNPKDELKTGTYRAMLVQLGITEGDLHE